MDVLKSISKIIAGAVLLTALSGSISAFAATQNGPQTLPMTIEDYDFANNILTAVNFEIKALDEIPANASFKMRVSGCEWSFENAEPIIGLSPYFTDYSGVYESEPRLTTQGFFDYSMKILSKTEIQITTNSVLNEGESFLVPMIVKMHGTSEGKVTIYDAKGSGITADTYAFTRETFIIPDATYKFSANATQQGSKMTGEITIDASAVNEVTRIRIVPPKGVEFDSDDNKSVTLSGIGGYKDAKLNYAVSNSNPLDPPYIPTDYSGTLSVDIRANDNPGTLKIQNLVLNVNNSELRGAMELKIEGFGKETYTVKFGGYIQQPSPPVSTKPEPLPITSMEGVNSSSGKPQDSANTVSLTVGEKQYTIGGEAHMLDAPPRIGKYGYPMVPIKLLSTAFDIPSEYIVWDETERTISVYLAETYNSEPVVFYVGIEGYTIGKTEILMREATVIVDGCAFIPASCVADILDIEYSYDHETGTMYYVKTKSMN